MRNMSRIKNQLMIQSINRWHIVPTVTQQTVADHTCGVMLIARWLWRIVKEESGHLCGYTTSSNRWRTLEFILSDALDHDLEEVGRGDIPRKDKSVQETMEGWEALTNDQRIIKLADYMEGCLTIKRLSPTPHGDHVYRYLANVVQSMAKSMLQENLNPGIEITYMDLVRDNIYTKILNGFVVQDWDYSVGEQEPWDEEVEE